MAAWNMKLARERRHPLPRHHPLYRRKLELSAEHTAFALGHRSLLENCPLFLCLMLGVHSSVALVLRRPPKAGLEGRATDESGASRPWFEARADARSSP